MKILAVVVLACIVCYAIIPIAAEGDTETEQKLWKKVEELVDVVGIEPNPVPDLAEKMSKKRFFIGPLFKLIFGSLVKGGASGAASAYVSKHV